jgi:lysophospholipid acyltransferase (LPLAT)-like uncharacterized protein
MKFRDVYWSPNPYWSAIRSWTVPRILRLFHMSLMLTLRISTTGVHRTEGKYHRTEAPGCLFVLWHEHTFIPLHVMRGQGIGTMMSTSRSGRMQAAFWSLYGWPIVWGSTKKREGITALREVLRRLKTGAMFGFTPDGPKGPRRFAHPGVVYLASKAPAIVLPISFVASKYWRLGTWDKYLIPKPFSKVHMHIGKPIEIPANLTREETELWQVKVAEALNEAERVAQWELEQRI